MQIDIYDVTYLSYTDIFTLLSHSKRIQGDKRTIPLNHLPSFGEFIGPQERGIYMYLYR